MIVGFVSNTITSVFKRKFDEFVEYPLDSIFYTLEQKLDLDYFVIILDDRFFEQNSMSTIEKLLKTFREKNISKIILSNNYAKFTDLQFLQETISDLAILDLYNLVYRYGYQNFINEKNKYLFQTPFTKLGVEKIVDEIYHLIELFSIKRKKLICVDGDNTLWGGIIGEDGIEGIQYDLHYPGIVYKLFQQELLRLKNEGIVLALVSKNNLSDVEELFAHKNMILHLDDFVSLKVNWEPKSINIVSIVEELNIGLESVIFFDDNDFELEEVKRALNIDVVKIEKEDVLKNIETIKNLSALKSIFITKEDKKKNQFYHEEKQRKEIEQSAHSLAEYIKSLNIQIDYNINKKENLQRITQLINKTNQFNLTTKRYSQNELEKLMNQQNAKIFDFSVNDRFGDMGLVGVVIVIDNFIDTFLLSCRVLGRDIEKQILGIIKNSFGYQLKAQFIATQKNMQVEYFYEVNGFKMFGQTKEGKLYETIN